jgi:hypothetical protein
MDELKELFQMARGMYGMARVVAGIYLHKVKAKAEKAKLWVLTLLQLGVLCMLGCQAPQYRTFQYGNGTAIDVQCSVSWECNETAYQSCPRGSYTILARGSTSMVYVCDEMSNDNTRASRFNR